MAGEACAGMAYEQVGVMHIAAYDGAQQGAPMKQRSPPWCEEGESWSLQLAENSRTGLEGGPKDMRVAGRQPASRAHHDGPQ